MKSFLLVVLCFFNINLFGQISHEDAYPPEFTTEEVRFKSAGDTLAGTIFKPQHPHTALVIVHGSGKEKRMLELASLLAGKGIAVLTYDKRGVGKSGGVYAGPEAGTNNVDPKNLNLLALDASAAGNFLLANLQEHNLPLGLMGFSQAGWIIPISAKQNRRVSFMVLFSGPVVSTLEQLRFQFYTESKSSFWETHTEAEVRKHIRDDADRYQFPETDPRDALGKLSVHGLWLFGGKDVQVPVGLSTERLNSLNEQGKHYEYRLFPELGHNTASSKSKEPIIFAIEWIKQLTGARNH